MSGEIVRVFGWGIFIGIVLGLMAYRLLQAGVYRLWPNRMHNKQEQENRRLRAEVTRLEKVIEAKNSHIQRAMEEAMKELPR